MYDIPSDKTTQNVVTLQAHTSAYVDTEKEKRTTTLSTFWCHQIVAYPLIAEKALEILIPFVTTYLCEQSFSMMVNIKTKKRNKLCCENDMRVARAKVKPRIPKIVPVRQQQQSH
ncbi:HAT C-terminal dimerization domain [Trinorchestia longiramus]|nr:HAT C-terminal dimerization domain [Trinorchestia longiramus]